MKEKEFDKKLNKINNQIRHMENVLTDKKYPQHMKKSDAKTLERLEEEKNKLLAEGTTHLD